MYRAGNNILTINGRILGQFNWEGITSYFSFTTTGSTIYDNYSNKSGIVTDTSIFNNGGVRGNGLLYAPDQSATKDVKISIGAAVNDSDNLSISWWQKQGAGYVDSYTHRLFCVGSLISNQYYGCNVYFSASKFTTLMGNGGVSGLASRYSKAFNNTFTNNQWYNVVITMSSYDSSKLYVNGIEYTDVTTSGNATSINWGNRYLYIGTISSAVYETNGLYLDEISTWNKVLTQAEISTLYNSGTGIFY